MPWARLNSPARILLLRFRTRARSMKRESGCRARLRLLPPASTHRARLIGRRPYNGIWSAPDRKPPSDSVWRIAVAGHPHIAGLVLANHVVVCALVAGCGAQSPAAPARVGSVAINSPSDDLVSSLAEGSDSKTVQARARTSHTLEVLEGTVTLTLADGSAIWGTYRGTANLPSSGQHRATFEGAVTGGAGPPAVARGRRRSGFG